jgi:hypothetical protein
MADELGLLRAAAVHDEDDDCSASVATTSQAETRLRTLHAWQRYYNMEPRGDSRLTRLFVNGEIDWPVEVVARELVATDFIYKHTLYGEILQDFMRLVALKVKDVYKLSWTATWKIVSFYAPIALKLILLDSAGLRIPHVPPPACERSVNLLVS